MILIEIGDSPSKPSPQNPNLRLGVFSSRTQEWTGEIFVDLTVARDIHHPAASHVTPVARVELGHERPFRSARLKQLESTVGGQVMVNNRIIKKLLTGHVNNHVDPAACFGVHGGADSHPCCYDNSQHHTPHLLFLTHFVLLIVQNNIITPATVLQVSFETPNFLISAKASLTFVAARLMK